MTHHLSDTDVAACFEEILNVKPININKYKEIIDKFCPINQTEISPLKIINPTGSTSKIKEQRDLEEEFYQEKFVPSPDLLLSYQQTFIKSLRGEQSSALVNNKLMNLYQKSPQIQPNPYAGKNNLKQEPVTQPYHNISNQYNYVPPRAQNKRIFVEEREQLILNELKEKSKIGLQMSIPVIEKSLMEYEIRNLQMKNISMQNLGKLSAWKSKREEIQNKLNAK